MNVRIKPGDYFEIALPDGRYAYCQYLSLERLGFLVRVLDKVVSSPISSVEELEGDGELFPPVFVGLRASVRSGRWKFVGNRPVREFKFPTFRSTFLLKPGTYDTWSLWDGKEDRFVGSLSPELRSLELEVVWGDEILEEQIASGKNPFAEVI